MHISSHSMKWQSIYLNLRLNKNLLHGCFHRKKRWGGIMAAKTINWTKDNCKWTETAHDSSLKQMSFSITQKLPTEPSRHRLALINSIKWGDRDSFCHPVALSFILSISFYLLPIICLHFNHFSVCIWTHLADAWYLLTLISRVQWIHSTCWKLRRKRRRSAYLTALNVPLYRQHTHIVKDMEIS